MTSVIFFCYVAERSKSSILFHSLQYLAVICLKVSQYSICCTYIRYTSSTVHHTTLRCTTLYNLTLRHTILYNLTLRHTILNYTALHYTTLYYTILYYNILYYTALHCTAPCAHSNHPRNELHRLLTSNQLLILCSCRWTFSCSISMWDF